LRLLITGGTGFIGSNLLDTLPKKTECTVLSRNLPSIRKMRPGVHYVAGDVRDYRFKSGLYTHVIHAAEAGPQGTRNVLRCNPDRFLYLSSGAAYYSGTEYANAKLASEYFAINYGGVIARCFSFMGPHMQLNGRFAAGNFIRDALDDQVIKIKGNGKAIRSYMYASDMTDWLWALLDKGYRGRIYNVGSHIPVTMNVLAKEIAHQVGNRIKECVTVEVENGTHISLAPDKYVPKQYRRTNGPKMRLNVKLKEAVSRTIDWATR
jgi:nucleoside-diphosphate-sugar epimerase